MRTLCESRCLSELTTYHAGSFAALHVTDPFVSPVGYTIRTLPNIDLADVYSQRSDSKYSLLEYPLTFTVADVPDFAASIPNAKT